MHHHFKSRWVPLNVNIERCLFDYRKSLSQPLLAYYIDMRVSVYASVFSISNVGLYALWCAIRCVYSGWCVWSWGTGCVHSCIDAITPSSAYLTAQTFFFLLPTPFPPSLCLCASSSATFYCHFFYRLFAFLHSPFLVVLSYTCSLSLSQFLLSHPLANFHSGSILCVLGIQQLQFLDKHPFRRIIPVVLTM